MLLWYENYTVAFLRSDDGDEMAQWKSQPNGRLSSAEGESEPLGQVKVSTIFLAIRTVEFHTEALFTRGLGTWPTSFLFLFC